MSRQVARETAFKVLYEIQISKHDPQEVMRNAVIRDSLAETSEIFCSELVLGVLDNLAFIDENIEKKLENWRLERLAPIDLAILRLAVFELFFKEDIPAAVSINEAVELAKSYHDVKSASFINGVLDNFITKN